MKRFEDVYRMTETRDIPECGGPGTVYEHIATGAKVFTLKNSDPNKVFLIGFRTTPKDSTGVAHIMEHSVLCGSEKFPLKDPFVELAKGSLNTFLNAMTYPDKTVYPVASTNSKDFRNLMDVYHDAVFHPNIRKEEKIFRQEGWHYELASEDGELGLNGVVYNEMKGVYSNPDDLLERYTLNSLYPDTTYGFESGGDPEDIPKLTYEDFLSFNKRFYHPSNSYLYLYGDLDMEEQLLWIDENYLSDFGKIETDSAITLQEPFKEPVHREFRYSVEEDDDESGALLSQNWKIPDTFRMTASLAWQILEFVLLQAPGAPLREALIAAGIGEDIYGGFTGGIREPYFSVVARNAEASDRAEFERVIAETLTRLVREGIGEKSLRAALNFIEFKYREADYGRIPAGLSYGLTALESWLYDLDPYRFLYYEDAFRELRTHLSDGWFEELLRKCLLENPHAASVDILPEKGLIRRREEALKQQLAEKKEGLSAEERRAIVRGTEELKRYQQEEDSPEIRAMLPVLKRSDISAEIDPLRLAERDGVLFTKEDSHGISYIRASFDVSFLTAEECCLLSFASSLLGEMDTAKRGYKELSEDVMLHTGGIDASMSSYAGAADPGKRNFRLNVLLSVLEENTAKGLEITLEMLKDTVFTDSARLKDKLFEARSRVRAKIENGAHLAAVVRAGSYGYPAPRFDDLTGGIAFYDWLSEACAKAEEDGFAEELGKKLRAVLDRVLAPEGAVLFLTGSEKGLAAFAAEKEAFLKELPGTYEGAGKGPEPLGPLNEGIRLSSQVNYVARRGNYLGAGRYTGSLLVLRMLLNYDYLWQRLRVLGGAYGCMSGFSRSGGYLVSYRDPHVKETNEVYEALPDWLASIEPDEEAVTKYIIGAVSALDHPLTVSLRASREANAYFTGTTNDMLKKEREELLGTGAKELRKLAAYLAAELSEGCICAIGNAGKIEENKELFGTIRGLAG